MKPLTLADVPANIFPEFRETWLESERVRLLAEENNALLTQMRPEVNTLIPGNEHDADSGRHTKRHRADISVNRAEELRQERLKWERRCEEMATELERAYWFEKSHHQALLDEIGRARHRYGDDALMRDLRKRLDAARGSR